VELHTDGDIAYRHVVRHMALMQDDVIMKSFSMTAPIMVPPEKLLQKKRFSSCN
jgi:hypothetical protein